MSSAASTAVRKNDYPTSDGRPMGETDRHCNLFMALRQTLDDFFAGDPNVYVSGNLLVFYEPGNRLRHLSPDVFVVKGVPKYERPNYLIWEERKSLDVVIELTSASTRAEDVDDKFQLYRDDLRVSEYFLFDPLGDYLDPPLRGYRLRQGKYQAIRAVKGRLPSKILGLHLERYGRNLRFYDPSTGKRLPTPQERVRHAERKANQAEQKANQAEQKASQAEQKANQAEQKANQAEQKVSQAEQKVSQVAAENERLRREVEELRRRRAEKP